MQSTMTVKQEAKQAAPTSEHLAEARRLAKEGKHRHALKEFTEAIQEKEKLGAPVRGSADAETLAEIYEARGNSYLQSDETWKAESAEKDFSKAIELLHPAPIYGQKFKLNPKCLDVSYLRGLINCQRYQEIDQEERGKSGPYYWIRTAESDFNNVLRLNSNHAGAYRWRGWVHQMHAQNAIHKYSDRAQEDCILAIKDYLHAIELDPKNETFYHALVQVFQISFEKGLNFPRLFPDPFKPADVDLVLAVMDPALWTCSAQKSVFGSPILGMSSAKEMALDRVLRFEDKAKKIEGLCQFLIQGTILGNLAYTGTLVSTPSFPKDKFLQKVAQELSKELTVENAAQLKKETLEAFRKDVKLQQALALHHKALHAKLLGVETPKLQDSKSTANVVQTRLVESKQMGLELKEIPKAVETAVPKEQPQQPNNAAEPKAHQQPTLILPEPFWSGDAALTDDEDTTDYVELLPTGPRRQST